MVTRQQMDTAGRKSADLSAAGHLDQALMVWVEALAKEEHAVQVWTWNEERLFIVRAPLDGDLRQHDVRWRQVLYVQGAPTYTVTTEDGEYGFSTALGAATFIVTGRNVNARPLAYRILVHRPGRVPETDPQEVFGIDEALDLFFEEVRLTVAEDRPSRHEVSGPSSSDRRALTERGRLTIRVATPEGVEYVHVIERVV